MQYDEDDGNNDQSMNPTTCLREAGTYITTEKAEQPQDYQNDDDSPQHEISPFLKRFVVNPSYSKPSQAASISRGMSVSAIWGRPDFKCNLKRAGTSQNRVSALSDEQVFDV
jgi:hypothetical protein